MTFVANYILLKLKEANRVIGLSDMIDFHVETPVNGIADLTADRLGKRIFVLEDKFKKKTGEIEHDIEPRDPDVIDQAVNYFGHTLLYHLDSSLKRSMVYGREFFLFQIAG